MDRTVMSVVSRGTLGFCTCVTLTRYALSRLILFYFLQAQAESMLSLVAQW